jgi:FixJ family two-component response regulator
MRDDAELLSKPFTISTLLEAVSRRIDQHDARDRRACRARPRC